MRGLVLVLAAAGWSAGTAHANDGFYQGSGATLAPMGNDKLRVKREDLEITPLAETKCYAVTESAKEKKATIGDEVPCPKGPPIESLGKVLRTKWHAKAIYVVEAAADVKDVKMGFPVPSWAYETADKDGRVDLMVPGVKNFKVLVDGDAPKKIDQEMVASVSPDAPASPAFTWTASFKKGKVVQLVSEYDFGVDYTNGMYEGSHFPAGTVLWFDQRSAAEARYAGASPFLGEVVRYVLTPLKLWAQPAPEVVHVRVEAPKNVPIHYMVPNSPRLTCVDETSLHFEWKNDTPEAELAVAYPAAQGFLPFEAKIAGFTKQWEYDAWNALLGQSMETTGDEAKRPLLSCALRAKIGAGLPKDSFFAGWIANDIVKCVEKCGL